MVSIGACVTKVGETERNCFLLIPTSSKHKKLLLTQNTLKSRCVGMVDGAVWDEVKVSRLVAFMKALFHSLFGRCKRLVTLFD